jgi:hypothetical protein
MEADRIAYYRRKTLDLYYKDAQGNFVEVGEAYSSEADELVGMLLKKKKMRYCLAFIDTFDLQDELKPSSFRTLRFFVKNMAYGNHLKKYGIRDIVNAMGLKTDYVISSIKQLCEKDILRFTVEKGRRDYMVNPIVFYKGTMKKMFYSTKEFNSMPKRDYELNIIDEKPLNIF